MTSSLPTMSMGQVRRLAIASQHLSGPHAPGTPTSDTILEVAQDLGCLQLDPTAAVARSHLLVLWSRLGPFDPAVLDTLLWDRRDLFEYFAHSASIVAARDYQVFQFHMRTFATGGSSWARRVRSWMVENGALRDSILRRLRKEGPLRSRDFEDVSVMSWASTGWTAGRNVGRMLDFLWAGGAVMVARRSGATRWWDLSERCLPPGIPRAPISANEAVRRAAGRSLRALGAAPASHIRRHFTRDGYPGLQKVLDELRAEGRIVAFRISGNEREREPWFVHADDVPLLEDPPGVGPEPHTVLLSPFDNLICDRERTDTIFGFRYRLELYVPKELRRFGYFAMPILHGDGFVGRLDPLFDRKRRRLLIRAIHAEPGIRPSALIGRAIRNAIEELAAFLGARDIEYPAEIPRGWRGTLR